ncbi:MAG: aldehyde dehydrogenase [Olegusella sp.]|nr:aldehyde dehydrogenase [Olegusella sp.]
MALIDNDLLSIQEARILLEHANESVKLLDSLPPSISKNFLISLRKTLILKIEQYATLAYEESDYCNSSDEARLIKWVLEDLLVDTLHEPPVQKIIEERNGYSKVLLSKGIVVSLLPEWLSVPTLISQLIFAVQSKSPIIFSADMRIHKTCKAVLDDVMEIASSCHYPLDAIGYINHFSLEGEQWVCNQTSVKVVIDSRENFLEHPYKIFGKDVYYATIGNNPVFIEATADIAECAREIVAGKSFCYGMLPGAEQSIVVESSIDVQVQTELKKNGCYFLSDKEATRLIKVLFKENGQPYRELIGKSAIELARRIDVLVPESTSVLVIKKPYVSKESFYAKAKYGPVLSYYVEENWRNACEKCIELILSSGCGNALSIFSNDPEVVKQFVIRKPVARVLVNVSTGLGSIGYHSDLPKTLTITGWNFATSSELGVAYSTFIRKRLIGIETSKDAHALLNSAAQYGSTAAVDTAQKTLPSDNEDHLNEPVDWFSSVLETMRDSQEKE